MMPGAVANGLIWGIMAIGVYITYRILDIADLTVDGSFATGGAVAAMLITVGKWNAFAALFAAFGAGVIAGLVTGLFHTKMGIPAILAGILTQLALYSINLRIMGNKSNVSVSTRNYRLVLASMQVKKLVLDNPILVLILMTALVIAVLYFFFGTEYGCALRAIGANSQMSSAQGINVNTGKVVGLAISNGLVALSGALLTQYQGTADVGQGKGAIVIGLAAVIIGEVIFSKVFHNFALKLLAVALGSVIYYLVIQVVLWLGLNTNDMKMITALVVAVFLAVPYWQKKFAGSSRLRKEAKNRA
ncbi:MAG: ABC transporter permease [Clostridia bacterium]|nr:ABC transporter permease [Clostridia bacterium]